jgi:hypothetical protein
MRQRRGSVPHRDARPTWPYHALRFLLRTCDLNQRNADDTAKWTPESSGHGAYYNRLIKSGLVGNSQRMFANPLETTIAVISSRRIARYSDAPWKLLHPEGVARVR